MGEPVTLLMAIHCHQPVGNFGFVFEDAYQQAYEPFLDRLEQHPTVRLALHYSGCLLDWLLAHRPQFLRRVRALVRRGQVELLASGYYEPILPLLPEADRQGQLALMQQALRKHCGERATGLWLTERVWEPHLPATIAQAGLRYTMVDTNQFAAAKPWLPSAAPQVQDEAFWDLLGCYATSDAASSVVLFPSSKRLRYWLPFQPVERTIEWLKRLQRPEGVAVTFADDGEKFGLWPKTHQWVYTEGWLDQFFGALERESSWLQTSTFRDYLARHATQGAVSLPCGSYEEMLEWSGGYFRNFFTKYPEANAMYHKMLRVSRTIQEVSGSRHRPSHSKLATRNSKLIERARRELYAGQCNCAYWHGVFGGLYLSHLRRAVYAHLIEAERLLEQGRKPAVTVERCDADGDGQQEIRLVNSSMSLIVDPQEGGAITEWNLFGARLNLLDVLSRRAEPYHEKLRAKALGAAVAAGGVPASIHDALGVKEEHLGDRLVYDDHRRSAWLEYGLQSLPTLPEVVRSTWGERRLWSPGAYQLTPGVTRKPQAATLTMFRELLGGRVEKSLQVAADAPRLTCRYALDGVPVPVLGVEFTLCLRDERYVQEAGQQSPVAAWMIEEPAVGVKLHLHLDPPATLLHFPIETVSESEEGLERTFQGVALLCLWTLSAEGGVAPRSWSGRLTWDVEVAHARR